MARSLEHPVGGPLGIGSGAEDVALVGFQGLEPAAQVRRVIVEVIRRQPQFGADESRPKFRDKFLFGPRLDIRVIADEAVAPQTALDAAAMDIMPTSA